jgi:hypothetical protein
MAMSWRKRFFILGLVIGLVLFGRQVWISYQAIQLHRISFVRPLYLPAALGTTVLVYLLQMLAWRMIMRHLGVYLPLRDTVQGFYLSFLPRYIPGTIWGYWTRSQWLEQSYAVSYAVSGTGSALEALALVSTGLFVAGTYLSTQTSSYVQIALISASTSLLALTCFAVPRLTTLIARRFYKEQLFPLPSKRAWFGPWVAALILDILLWGMFGTSLLFIGSSLSSGSLYNLPVTVFASSLSWVVGFVVVFVPTGLGVRELTLSTLLASYANSPPWQADLVAVLSRFGLILAEMGWLLVGLVFYTRVWRRMFNLRERFPPFRRK